jgi:biotin operon repressor
MKWEWYTDPNTFRLFFHLVLSANHEKGRWKGIDIERGQHVTSSDKLAFQLELSRQQIRTSLKKLESTQEITIKTTNRYTVITIEKYDFYQDDARTSTNKTTNEQPTNNQQITTNNNDNNKKNENKEQVNICLYDYWQEKAPHKHRSLNENIKKALNGIKAKEVGNVKIAIDRYVMAFNDNSYFYNQKWVFNNFLKQSNGYKQWLDDGQNWVMYQGKVKEVNDKSKGNIIGAKCNTGKITRRPHAFSDVIVEDVKEDDRT